jgi:phospholipid/cholesterol/gamma-HCH transport system substrate-binding protein
MNSLDDFTRMRRFTQNDPNFTHSRPRKFNALARLFTLLMVAIISIGAVAAINSYNGVGYQVYAEFDSVGGLPEGAPIEMGGVQIGMVSQVSSTDSGLARVQMHIEKGIVISQDSLISVQSRGDMGGKIVTILPGQSDKTIGSGETFADTEPGGLRSQEI